MESVAYEDLLRKEGKVITHVVGGSMLPLLRNRESIVIVESSDRVAPRRGDVVLYKMDGSYILHRVLCITPAEYQTRGDNTWVTEHVPREALLATMTGFYRYPESRFVSRNDILYRLYRAALPCIRWIQRFAGKGKRMLKKLWGLL